MKGNNKASLAKFSAIGIYLLIAVEFFYMASPFAMYFYSVYKPGLNLINSFPPLAWMTGFFMPHLVADTKSALLNSLPTIGAITAVLGFLFFLICAIQIYYAKLFKKKAVTGGIYKYIRHPQYTAFAISSFGLLLLWPRYLTLFFYITLLFVYYWLARREEKECIHKFGESYSAYMEKTAMFFPLPSWFKNSEGIAIGLNRIHSLGKFLLVVGITLLIAVGIKTVSIKQLHSFSHDEGIWLSIFKTDKAELINLARLVQNSATIDSLIIHKAKAKCELINYVLPAEMYISEIPMIKPAGEECHVSSVNYDHSKIKIIITRGIHKNDALFFSGNKLIKNTLTLKPIAEVWVDTDSYSIIKTIDLPESERYTNIPEPIF